jgi:hypothetical protein
MGFERYETACLISMQKRLQVIEPEGAANGDCLCCITSPKLTVRVATNGPKNCPEG